MNDAQAIQLLRIKLGSFNSFNGDKVGQMLEDNPHLWKAVVFGRFDFGQLIELRDLDKGHLNADTIIALVRKPQLKPFVKLAKLWQPDEIGWNWMDEKHILQSEGTAPFRDREKLLTSFGSSHIDDYIVRLWWD